MGSPSVEVGTLRVRKGPGSRVAPDHPCTPRPFPPLPGLRLPLGKLSLPSPQAHSSREGLGPGD